MSSKLDFKEQKNMKINKNIDMGGWSFLKSLTTNNNNKKDGGIENEKVYVRPLHNHSSSSSSSKLSTMSLEMCTESLGNETGSDSSSGDEILHFNPSQATNYENCVIEKRKKHRDSFPPPLTSINGVQLKPQRNGGRLVLKAESVPSCLNYFQVERSDGWLKLRLTKNCYYDCDHDEVEEEEDEIENQEIETEETEEVVYVGEEEEEEENGEKVRGEMGVKVVSITSKCKEGKHEMKGLLDWEPFCVAS